MNVRSVLVVVGLSLVCAGLGRAQPRVDQGELMQVVDTLAADGMEGRRVGTEGNARARAFLEAAFSRIALQPVGASYAHPFTFHPARGDSVQGVNLLGLVPGTRRTDVFLVVTAHYDHLGVRNGTVYNGADDNASGVAALLALARYFKMHPPQHSMIFAALDAEEVGLQGARALVRDPPVPLDQVALNVNLDMVGRNADGELYASGTAHYPFLRPYLEAVASRSPITLRFGHDGRGGEDWTFSSDHGPFHRQGIPFVYFGVEDHPDYHKPTDDPEGIEPEFFRAAVETILDAVVRLDERLDDVQAASGR